MAQSFGGHPTLKTFVDEAEALGCTSVVEPRQTLDGKEYTALIVTSPFGSSLTIADPEFTERLSPSVITNYERRLGIQTRFAGTPDPPTDATYDDDPP